MILVGKLKQINCHILLLNRWQWLSHYCFRNIIMFLCSTAYNLIILFFELVVMEYVSNHYCCYMLYGLLYPKSDDVGMKSIMISTFVYEEAKVKVKSLRPVWLFSTPCIVAHQLLCPWAFPGKNIGVGCQFLLQEISLTQGLNPGLLHCRQTLYHLSHQGNGASNPKLNLFQEQHCFKPDA